jgi:hypothetical protein
MQRGLVFVTAGAPLWSVVASRVCAQRGMGDPTGVASQAVKPEVVTLLGEVLKVNTEPCEMDHGARLSWDSLTAEDAKRS